MPQKGLLILLLSIFVFGILNVGLIAAEDPPVGDGSTVEEDMGKAQDASRTDDEAVKREEEAIDINNINVSEIRNLREKSEKHQFQAEVDRMMKLIINSLYKNKEIFLRELISNASDALDKIRLLSLTDKEALAATSELSIKIKADKDARTLHIIDTGIGMTKSELMSNLGTIAKSGTSDFLSKMTKSETENEMNDLIGQFGVGFYSAFLIADEVTVVSKHNSDKQHIWTSDASTFTIIEDPRGDTLKRGTEVILKLKEETQSHLEDSNLRDLIRKYSQFINFPIYVWTSKTEMVDPTEEEAADKKRIAAEEKAGESKEASEEEPTTAGEKEGEEKSTNQEDATVEDEKPSTPSGEKIEKTVWDWEQVNQNKPIWTKKPSNVTDGEYNDFYKAFTKDQNDPLTKTHFNAEGEVTFKSILFIGGRSDSDLLTTNKKSDRIKMYVRRVFITDNFEEMMPNYLNFVQGVVDSDDLPLNVSRETLQQHKLLKVIKKKLVRKTLDMIKRLSKKDYETFWKEYSTNIKMGIYDDSSNRTRLSKLLRYWSSHSETEMTGLEDYVERMKQGQETIYYITGNNLEDVKKSPFVERLLKKGYEVLYMTDPIDEYSMPHLTEFDGKKIQNVAKEGLNLDSSDKQKEKKEQLTKDFKPVTDYLQDVALKDMIEKAEISERLIGSPCALIAPSHGWSGNMERIMTAQAIQKASDPTKLYHKKEKKIFEINPRHPLVKELKNRIANDVESDKTKDLALILFETATLRSGFILPNTINFAERIEKILRESLQISQEEQVEEEPEEEPAPASDSPQPGSLPDMNSDEDYDAGASPGGPMGKDTPSEEGKSSEETSEPETSTNTENEENENAESKDEL